VRRGECTVKNAVDLEFRPLYRLTQIMDKTQKSSTRALHPAIYCAPISSRARASWFKSSLQDPTRQAPTGQGDGVGRKLIWQRVAGPPPGAAIYCHTPKTLHLGRPTQDRVSRVEVGSANAASAWIPGGHWNETRSDSVDRTTHTLE
jgi:hypothetical protein